MRKRIHVEVFFAVSDDIHSMCTLRVQIVQISNLHSNRAKDAAAQWVQMYAYTALLSSANALKSLAIGSCQFSYILVYG